MRTLLLVAVVLAMTATVSWANPFCDCTKGTGGIPTAYNIEGLGAFMSVTTDIPAQSDGNFRLDLATLPQGSYTVRVRAKNLMGVSEWSDPLAFTLPALPTKPMAPRLSAQ
jgi:hypothetical protein